MNLTGKGAPGQKVGNFVSKEWRESADGKECELQLEGCNRDPSTTVLGHLRFFGWAGINQKPDDYLGIYVCTCCHDVLDGRGSTVAVDGYQILRALGNTLKIHYAEGRIK